VALLDPETAELAGPVLVRGVIDAVSVSVPPLLVTAKAASTPMIRASLISSLYPVPSSTGGHRAAGRHRYWKGTGRAVIPTGRAARWVV
jgi:hypothetical protein